MDTSKTNLSPSSIDELAPATASPVTGPTVLSNPNDNISNSLHTSLMADDEPKSARDTRKASLNNFSEQIRRLEIEGNKLRAATFFNLGSINGFSNVEAMDNIEKTHSPDLNNLMDFSADQKCISDLRIQLDTQRRETERLQQQLLGDTIPFNTNYNNVTPTTTNISNGRNPLSALGVLHNLTPGVGDLSGVSNNSSANSILSQHQQNQRHNQSHGSPVKSAFSTIPSGEMGADFARRNVYGYQPPSHLERSLKESQEQVMDLRKKLQEMEEVSTQHKKQFRGVVEELKTKLHDTIMNRDMVLELRQKESHSQEQLINKLQSSLTQLQDQYQAHEEVLASTTRRLEQQAQTSHITETTLEKVRTVLVQWEKNKQRKQQDGGREGGYFSLFTSASHNLEAGAEGSGDQGNTVFLGHALERCLQELEHEITMKNFRVTELESDLEEFKKKSADKEQSIIKEYQDLLKKEADEAAKKFSLLDQEHERNTATADASLSHLRQQVAALQTQIQDNESLYQQELRAKLSDIRELEDKAEELKTDNMKTKAVWQQKRQAMETSMDEVQKELVEVKSEKNELIRTHAALETRLEDLQGLVARHEADLDTEREKVQQQRQREEELRSQVMTLELSLANKQGEVERLERMFDVVKQECSSQVLDKVASAEKLERERYLDQIHSLSSQLGSATEKYNRASLEAQTSRSEMESLRTQVHDLTEKLEKARSQMEAALAEKQELSQMLGDRRVDLDRLRREKDHLEQVSEQRAEEVTELRISTDRLRVQLEEKEKVLTTLRQQSSNITQLMEVNNKASDDIKEERERLTSVLTDQSSQLEEIRTAYETLTRKLKAKEKRARDLDDERLKVTEELAVRTHEIETMQKDRDAILKELKDSRSQVATLTSGKDALKKELARTRALRNKELTKLQAKLKESEEQYKLSQKALKSKDMMDHKAVRFADKIQKEMTMKRSELDLVMSKVHKQEDMLETLTKEKSMVERDKDSLKKSLAKSLLHTQSLTEELQTTQAQNRQLVQRVASLEEELEKAATKSTASAAQLKKAEEDLNTLKLKHQLDLQEINQSNRSKSSVRSAATNISQGTSSSLPSTASTVRGKGGYPYSYEGRERTASVDGSAASQNEENDSDIRSQIKDTLQLRDERHRDYGAVGQELKLLLSEMRDLISSGHKSEKEYESRKGWDTHRAMPNFSASDGAHNSRMWERRRPAERDLGPSGPVSDSEFNLNTDRDKSWASKSFSGLDDLSDFSAYKDWRPRSSSVTRVQQHSPHCDTERSFVSKAELSDISRLSQSQGSPSKSLIRGVGSVPDTQELCRRLEEKINSLTQMGGNLVKENREMADLITLQGEKLVSVKETERAAWGKAK